MHLGAFFVDCFDQILHENNVGAGDIQSVHVKTIQRAVDYLSSPQMTSLYDSQFSLPMPWLCRTW